MSTHFTAVIEVHKVVNTEAVTHYRTPSENKPAVRETAEVARIVVRADSIEKLQSKLTAHVALIEES